MTTITTTTCSHPGCDYCGEDTVLARWVSTPDGSAQRVRVDAQGVCTECLDAGNAFFDEDGQPQGTGYLLASDFGVGE